MGEKRRSVGRFRRRRHVRKKVFGTSDRPRVSVFRSLKHIYVQLVDDNKGRTLASASTMDPDVRTEAKGLGKAEQARVVGRVLATRALEKGVKKVVFDRSGYKYHGRVKALAEAAREGGLDF